MKSKPKCRICGRGGHACSWVEQPDDLEPLCSLCWQFKEDLEVYLEQTGGSLAGVTRAYHECVKEFEEMVGRVRKRFEEEKAARS